MTVTCEPQTDEWLSRLHETGATLVEVQAYLGHTSVQTAAYLGSTPKALETSNG